MPGGLHLVFGLIIGLSLWKLSENDQQQKKWDISLIFLYAFQNHFGPDFGGAIRELGAATKSESLYLLGLAIHSYGGWIWFAPVYALLFTWLLHIVETKRAKILANPGNNEKINVPYRYPEILLFMWAGGLSHFFVDAIGHYVGIDEPVSNLPWKNYVRGQFTLFSPITPGVILWFLVLGTIFALPICISILKQYKFTVRQNIAQILPSLKSKSWMKVYLCVIILIFDCGIMYGIMVWGNALEIRAIQFEFTGATYYAVQVHVGNMLYASSTGLNLEVRAEWYYVLMLCVFVLLFLYSYSLNLQIKIFKRNVPVATLSMGIFLFGMVIGYIIQPQIGNISGAEADFGAFIFLFATLGSVFLFFLLNREPKLTQ